MYCRLRGLLAPVVAFSRSSSRWPLAARSLEALEASAALSQRFGDQRLAGMPEQVVERERDGNLGSEEKVIAAAAEAPLQFGEGQRAAVPPGQQFRVADEILGQGRRGPGELGKLGRQGLQVARV